MLISELIRILEGVIDDEGDMEVRYAAQPSWPFEYSISQDYAVCGSNDTEIEEITNVLLPDLPPEEKDSVREHLNKLEEENERVMYLAEGSQLNYLPAGVSHELGWR